MSSKRRVSKRVTWLIVVSGGVGTATVPDDVADRLDSGGLVHGLIARIDGRTHNQLPALYVRIHTGTDDPGGQFALVGPDLGRWLPEISKRLAIDVELGTGGTLRDLAGMSSDGQLDESGSLPLFESLAMRALGRSSAPALGRWILLSAS